MKAQAVVFTAPRQVEFMEIHCPDPGPEDVVVRLTHSWISNGTEGSFLRGERIGTAAFHYWATALIIALPPIALCNLF